MSLHLKPVIATRGDVSPAQVEWIESQARPLAAMLLRLEPDERYDVMASLICSVALSYSEPGPVFETMVDDVRSALPSMEARARLVREAGR
jgi:hypothetical protein